MKSKLTLLLILSLTVIGCVTLAGCKGNNKSGASDSSMHYAPNKSADITGHVSFILKSEPIRKIEAEKLREYYLKFPTNILPVLDANNNSSNQIKFNFDAADIDEILHRLTVTPGTPDKVVFNFGLDSNDPGDPVSGGIWHLIAYGMTTPFDPVAGGKLLDFPDPTSHKYTIFNNSDDAPGNTRKTRVQAQALRSNYRGNRNFQRTVRKDGVEVNLYGFSFNADQIQEILHSNTSRKVPDQVTIYLGLESVNGHRVKRWHVIAYGSIKGVAGAPDELLDVSTTPSLVSATNSITTLTFKAESVFDKADPCPPCN